MRWVRSSLSIKGMYLPKKKMIKGMYSFPGKMDIPQIWHVQERRIVNHSRLAKTFESQSSYPMMVKIFFIFSATDCHKLCRLQLHLFQCQWKGIIIKPMTRLNIRFSPSRFPSSNYLEKWIKGINSFSSTYSQIHNSNLDV